MNKQDEPVRKFVKRLRKECGTYRTLYEKLYGEPAPNKQAVQNLTNYVNRGMLDPEFLRKVIDGFGLGNMPLNKMYNYDGKSRILDFPEFIIKKVG